MHCGEKHGHAFVLHVAVIEKYYGASPRWLLGGLCSVSRILGLMLIIFAALYLVVHGLWCSEPIRKVLALLFEELGQLTWGHHVAV